MFGYLLHISVLCIYGLIVFIVDDFMKQVPSEIRTVAFNKESINVNFHSLSKITGTKCNYTFILIFITTYYLLHMFFFFLLFIKSKQDIHMECVRMIITPGHCLTAARHDSSSDRLWHIILVFTYVIINWGFLQQSHTSNPSFKCTF